MALEVRFKVENLGVAVSGAGYVVIDSDRNDVAKGFADIDTDGNIIIPITSQYVAVGEMVRPTVDDFTGSNFDETGTATDWIAASEVYVDFSVVQSDFTVYCINQTGVTAPWNMGDGTIIDEVNPIYLYKKNGTFTITNGAFSKTIVVTGVNEFSVTLNGNTITCINQSGYDEPWLFGNGDTDSNKNPTYTYFENGTYLVQMGQFSVEITVDYYTAGLIASQVGNTLVFVRPNGETANFKYGDGFEGQSSTHVYAQHGKFLVEVGDYRFFVDVVGVGLPKANFTYSADEVNPTQVTFIATGGESYKFIINGLTFTNETETYNFPNKGSYQIDLKAIGENGAASYVTKNIYVQEVNVNPVFVSIEVTKTLLHVEAEALVTDDENEILTYVWDHGDGTAATGRFMDHDYEDAGEYLISCTVQDGRGGYATLSKTINVDQTYTFSDDDVMTNPYFDTADKSDFSEQGSDLIINGGVATLTSTDGSQDRIDFSFPSVVGQEFQIHLVARNKAGTNGDGRFKNWVGVEVQPIAFVTFEMDSYISVIKATGTEITGRFYVTGGGVAGDACEIETLSILEIL
ncbi:PKD domain-containing protein [Psychromonas sp. SR45-3]|uniref:PKD domain-containing protein n=1 Tax=Psychromonas sp. SR45-3 TaxID=2760930 RepID=UPI0015FAC063|nr:PKD domain-containing protein [Psychromonas sp. SR45-3]MBB1272543.1 PKD domain-containing protein [Psychromonas sp. SR45-3]